MEKDGSGGYTTKPKSEWKRKGSGKKRPYWEAWNEENDNISEATSAEKAEEKPSCRKTKTSRNEVTTTDICHFLAKRMTVGAEGEEEPISYTQVETFTMAILHVIADCIIDNCVVNLDDLGTIRNRNYRINRTEAFQPHFTPNKDLMQRINVNGDKFLARTYNIGYQMRDERKERERKAEYHAAYDRERLLKKKEEEKNHE